VSDGAFESFSEQDILVVSKSSSPAGLTGCPSVPVPTAIVASLGDAVVKLTCKAAAGNCAQQ